MNIEEIFLKSLVRDINGVIKAEQLDNECVRVELDEYVITKELDRHFRSFFEAYIPARNNREPALKAKNGVWVSGFFGSGKSHFIKILSYLLENRRVEKNGESRNAIDFFNEKISDALLLGDIQKAVSQPTDVILFNIDSRANTDDGDNAILKVFLKVFNEKLGYCADFPHIAHLERGLDKLNQYQAFQEKFAELTGTDWKSKRDAYDFYRDELSQSLAAASNQTLDSTHQWVEQLETRFRIDTLNILNFCTWVNDYLKSHGDRNILFLVDEVGQFIGQNAQMMLKLQTITEDLSTFCNGRAWVIVTSQADIEAAVGQLRTNGDDFSRIRGRFHTRLQLSSSNTSEVIQKRLLEKTENAIAALANVFTEKGDILRNQLAFDKTTTAELNGYTDLPSFIHNYPFVPYHYPLVQKVFESIRTRGAAGIHLAMGERSLLDAFQSAAKQIKDKSIGALIPFYSFYNPIESFLEPAVKCTIDQACELNALNDFDGKLLKTLFLIRYVDKLNSTLDNLVTLCIDQIDADKITLRKQIEESLNRLERQMLIARNGDEFIFLTNEEKEIENEILRTPIEPSKLTNKLSNLIFDDLLSRQNTYRYPVNKQDFKISRFCNGHPRDGSSLEDLVVKVTSPLDTHYEAFIHDQTCIQHTLEGDGCILVKLPDHQHIFGHKGLEGELARFLKTDLFLTQNSGLRREQEHLLREKQLENIEREKRLRHELEQLISEAQLFAFGTKLTPKTTSLSAMLEEAYKYVIENTFAKLNMLRLTPGDISRELHSVMVSDDLAQAGIDMDALACNPEATREIERFINVKIERNEAVYLRDLIDRFIRRPFGWPNNEILLIVARLGLAGRINFTQGATELPLKKAYDTFISVRKQGEIRINKIRQHDELQLKKASILYKNLFNKTFTGTGEKELAERLRQELNQWYENLNSFNSKAQTGHFPGKPEIEQGLILLADLLQQSNSFKLIERCLEQQNALEDFAEDFESLNNFYKSQFHIWQKLSTALNDQFKANRPFLENIQAAQQALDELERIYAMPSPYDQLRHISPLIEQLHTINQQLILERRKIVETEVEQRIERVQAALKQAATPDDVQNKALRPLQLCKQRISSNESIPQIVSDYTEAANNEDEAYDLINRHIESLRQKETSRPAAPIPNENTLAEPAPKRTITISQNDILNTVSPKGYIETETDIDRYLNLLRERLTKAVIAGDRVRIK